MIFPVGLAYEPEVFAGFRPPDFHVFNHPPTFNVIDLTSVLSGMCWSSHAVSQLLYYTSKMKDKCFTDFVVADNED